MHQDVWIQYLRWIPTSHRFAVNANQRSHSLLLCRITYPNLLYLLTPICIKAGCLLTLNSKLRAAKPRVPPKNKRSALFFVTRLHKDTIAQEIEEHVKCLTKGEKVLCESIRTKFDSYSSYKISVPWSYMSAVSNVKNWPAGILIRRYYEK